MKDGMLEFSDWPMFDLLMTDKELCREVIEICLLYTSDAADEL